jgi:hypothetical protein
MHVVTKIPHLSSAAAKDFTVFHSDPNTAAIASSAGQCIVMDVRQPTNKAARLYECKIHAYKGIV